MKGMKHVRKIRGLIDKLLPGYDKEYLGVIGDRDGVALAVWLLRDPGGDGGVGVSCRMISTDGMRLFELRREPARYTPGIYERVGDGVIKPVADGCRYENNCWCGIDLGGADLRGANLYGAYLYGANLRGVNLRGANLCGANLCGAYLYGADLRGANLYGANLREANLREANLREANLYGADLGGANLREANLCGANLRGANLGGALISKSNKDYARGCGAIVDEGVD